MIRILAAIGMTLLVATPALAESYCAQVREAVATYGYAAARRHALHSLRDARSTVRRPMPEPCARTTPRPLPWGSCTAPRQLRTALISASRPGFLETAPRAGLRSPIAVRSAVRPTSSILTPRRRDARAMEETEISFRKPSLALAVSAPARSAGRDRFADHPGRVEEGEVAAVGATGGMRKVQNVPALSHGRASWSQQPFLRRRKTRGRPRP